jgi:hypothetical protein
MRHIVALIALILFAGMAAAQEPYPGYNWDRAYAHYMASQSPLKTISTMQPARAWGYDTPWESVRAYQSPSYYHEQSSLREGRSWYASPTVVSSSVVQYYPIPVPVYPRVSPDPANPPLVYPPLGYPYR